MKSSHQQDRLAWRIAQASAALALSLALHTPAAAQQPCNPVIDGTYCATQMPRSPAPSASSRVQMRPIEDIGSSIAISSNSPATLGSISFGRGTDCIGLLRRGACR
jgi:hypothetical protein